MNRPARTALVGALLALALASCQLVDPPEQLVAGEPQDDRGGADPDDLLGNPDEEWPQTLVGTLALARPEALTWQEQPVLADLTVYLESPGAPVTPQTPVATDPVTAAAAAPLPPPGRVAWSGVRLTYVAAHADRMLTVRATPETLRVQRPRLAGLGLPELPVEAVAAMTPLPEDVLEPEALAIASAGALADCGAAGERVRAVLYATGAPAAWDAEAGQWSPVPTWRATVVTATVGVSVDPTSGTAFAPLTCVEPIADLSGPAPNQATQ